MKEETRKQIEQLLATKSERAFLFDFDGTLVDLVVDPEAVDVPLTLRENIASLIEQTEPGQPAFALVTGRPFETLERFLGGLKPPALAAHGAEYREKGNGEIRSLAEALPAFLIGRIETIAKQEHCSFENKRYTVSFHLPPEKAGRDLEPELNEALGKTRDAFIIRKVGRTYEIMRKGTTKGAGLTFFLSLPAFANRAPVYIGDDVGIDRSLDFIRERGGTLLSVKTEDPILGANPEGELTTQEARAILAALL